MCASTQRARPAALLLLAAPDERNAARARVRSLLLMHRITYEGAACLLFNFILIADAYFSSDDIGFVDTVDSILITLPPVSFAGRHATPLFSYGSATKCYRQYRHRHGLGRLKLIAFLYEAIETTYTLLANAFYFADGHALLMLFMMTFID